MAHASLYPLEPVVVSDDKGAKGHVVLAEHGLPHPGSQRIPGTKSSWDFNVCTSCYLAQRKRRYPEDDFSVGEQKLRMNAEIGRLKKEYAKASALAAARSLLKEAGDL